MSHPVDGGVQPTVARSSSQHAGGSVHNARDGLQCVASFCGGVVVMTASPPGHYHAKPPLPPSPLERWSRSRHRCAPTVFGSERHGVTIG